jgi:hypothetical protein
MKGWLLGIAGAGVAPRPLVLPTRPYKQRTDASVPSSIKRLRRHKVSFTTLPNASPNKNSNLSAPTAPDYLRLREIEVLTPPFSPRQR